MSTRSKLFFGFSVLCGVTIIPYVHYFQNEQSEVLHEGPLKDVKRRERKLNEEQKAREQEYEEQKRLQKELAESNKEP
ncbi:hypothetical protein DASB73_009530 [Starmerella bacillaris]|uniref:Uncharacterized protein n=1 Tax=Starmerella bacillaris TaxID=1247836 RepID=A0AAV5RF58_STABA|nr:hypothetical protein DASB73_009530 [Starmerella bacillaris]